MKITAVTPSVVKQWISTYIVWEGFISLSLSSICYNDYVLPEMKIQSQSQQSSFLTTGLLLQVPISLKRQQHSYLSSWQNLSITYRAKHTFWNIWINIPGVIREIEKEKRAREKHRVGHGALIKSGALQRELVLSFWVQIIWPSIIGWWSFVWS